MESDCQWRENTRRTKQMRGPKTRIFPNRCEFAFRHSTPRKRQDRGLHQKTLSRHITEGCWLFVRMCNLHQQQKGVADHQKKPINHAIHTEGFMNHVEINLMEFQKLAMSLSRTETHMATSCFRSLYKAFLDDSSRRKTQYSSGHWVRKAVYMFGFPKTLHSDNGAEFKINSVISTTWNLCPKKAIYPRSRRTKQRHDQNKHNKCS